MFPLAFTHSFEELKKWNRVEILFFFLTTRSISAGSTLVSSMNNVFLRVLSLTTWLSRDTFIHVRRNIISRCNRDVRFLYLSSAPDLFIVNSIIHPVRLTSSFVFTFKDSSQSRTTYSSKGDILPLMRYTIAMAVMATIVISSNNKIEDVRMNFCDYNEITKIAEVANINSDISLMST